MLALVSWRVQLVILARLPFFISMSTITPIAYATVLVFMAGAEADLRTAVGAGLMGAWSVILFGAVEALLYQRYIGILELMIGAPRSLVAPILGCTAAAVTVGGYSLVMTLVWSGLVLGVPIALTGIADMLLPLGAVFLSLMAMGVPLSSIYLLARKSQGLNGLLRYIIWIICGIAVPTTLLWPPLTAAGRLFPLGWAMAAVDEAGGGGNPLFSLLVALFLSVVYVALGIFLLHRVAQKIRVLGTLRLW